MVLLLKIEWKWQQDGGSDFIQFSLLKLCDSNILWQNLFYLNKSKRHLHTSYTFAKMLEPGKVSISKEKGSGDPVCYAKICAPATQKREPHRR